MKQHLSSTDVVDSGEMDQKDKEDQVHDKTKRTGVIKSLHESFFTLIKKTYSSTYYINFQTKFYEQKLILYQVDSSNKWRLDCLIVGLINNFQTKWTKIQAEPLNDIFALIIKVGN